MDAGPQGATVARATRHEREARTVLLRGGEGDVDRERMLRQAVAAHDHRRTLGGPERRRGARLEGPVGRVAAVDPLHHVGLMFWKAELVLGHVP